MPYTRYSDQQRQFIKQHYQQLSNAELAQALGIDKPTKVRELARRLSVKWRAENGAPKWREPAQPPRVPRRLAA